MTQKSEEGGAKVTTYMYNDANQFTQISCSGTETWTLTFYYDGLGRRIKTEYYDGQTTTTRKFVYLGGSVIRELTASDQVVRIHPRWWTWRGNWEYYLLQRRGELLLLPLQPQGGRQGTR